MKKIFSILLSLALVVSLGVLTAAPVMAVTMPSISPTSATYNLDSPTQIVVGITMGSAVGLANITNIGTGAALSAGTDYVMFETIVVFNTTYLDGVLLAPGQALHLQFNFDMGLYTSDAFFDVLATGTNPTVSPNSVNWSFDTKGNITTGILWGFASDIVTVGDDVTNNIAPWSHNLTTLLIEESYFTTRWPSSANISQSVVLNIDFNKGTNATLTVKCVGTALPALVPTTVYWDFLAAPSNATFAITWDGATDISSVIDVTYLSGTGPSTLTRGASGWNITADNKTLIIMQPWLAGRFSFATYDMGMTYRLLEATFNNPASTKIQFLIVASPSLPSISPVTANWDMDNAALNYVYTVPTWGGTGKNITRATDQDGYVLWAYNATQFAMGLKGGACNVSSAWDWRCSFNPLIGVYVASFWRCYILGTNRTYNIPGVGNGTLIGRPILQNLGDKAILKLTFDVGGGLSRNVTFNITAIGKGGSLSLAAANFNLDAPANVTATVIYGSWAKNITSINSTGTTSLVRGVDFTLVPDGGNVTTNSTLTISKDYLATVLAAVDDTVALKVVFDTGDPAVLTITATGTPSCFIATAVGADEPQLDILRAFRDDALRGNPVGDALISLYYKVSPSIAEVISDNCVLKAAVKAWVDLIVDIL